jgi:hypothetical protein
MLALDILAFTKRRINYTENHERPSMLMTQATRYVSEVWMIETFKSEQVAVRFTSWR